MGPDMRLRTLSYGDALRLHPNETRKVVQQLRRSRSKHKLADPHRLVWTYEAAVSVTSLSATELVYGRYRRPEPKSPEEEARDATARTQVSLTAQFPGGWFGSEALMPLPPEAYAWHLRNEQAKADERARFVAVSPVGKATGVLLALQALSKGSPVLAAFTLDPYDPD